MARTLAALLLPTLALAISWLRLETPRSTGAALAVATLAILPAVAPRGLMRALALAAGAVGTAWIAFAAQPWELLPFRDERVLGPVTEQVALGIGDYYGVVLPFDPERHPEMEALLLCAVFGFVCAVALLVAARLPLAAAAVTVAGVGWPATLLGDGAVLVGALALGAALAIFLTLRVTSGRALALGVAIGALVVAGAAWTSSATTLARESVLEWQTWDFRGLPAKAIGVRFVWDANYDGISFPPTETLVLEIEGPKRAQYWRASTLDTFTADRWIEDLVPFVIGDPTGDVPLGGLTPRVARDRGRWVEQRVEVKALVDDRLVAAGTPTALEARSLGTVFYLSGGVVRARQALKGGTRYRVWSYVPNPSPAVLAAAPARYPSAARRFLSVWGKELPPFASPGRADRVRALLDEQGYPAFAAYGPLYDEAVRVAGSARTPYSAVLALESWFRQLGGFRYDERPPTAADAPPLVRFVTETKAGYCQHFAGAMAVMLRFLGIPARVAVGFTSGRDVDGVWKVTDHDAHAWVEAWFPGQGWVAFDPTPGRGRFAGIYSFASESAAAVAALGRGDLGDGGRRGAQGLTDGRFDAVATSKAGDPPSIVALALLLAALAAVVIGAVKWLVRRLRYLTIQPRLIAAASRKELESFLRDQGVAVAGSATLDDLRQAVGESLGLDGRAFVEAAGRGRFGPPGDARRSAQAARAELKKLLKRARGELSFWARARGFFSLRSLRGWQG